MKDLGLPLADAVLVLGGVVQFCFFMWLGPMFLFTWASILSLALLLYISRRFVFIGLGLVLPCAVLECCAGRFPLYTAMAFAPWILAVALASWSGRSAGVSWKKALLLYPVALAPFFAVYWFMFSAFLH